MTVIIFLIVLGILIFVHELGHFLVAKLTGMRVDEFAIGFPPRIFSKKIGETEYSLNLIPIGGYVKIFGENPDDLKADESPSDEGFLNKRKLSRFSVLSAGVLFNFLFAWLCLSIVFMFGILAPEGYLGYSGDSDTTVIAVQNNSPADNADLREGDQVLSISAEGQGKIVDPNAGDVISFIAENQNSTIDFDVQRGDQQITFNITPVDGIVEGKKAVGASFENMMSLSLPVHKAVYQGYLTTIDLTNRTVIGMKDFFVDIFKGEDGALEQVAGPVGIASMVGQASELGLTHLITFTAVISISLAVLNLIPFPALDGGQLVFVILEAISGKKINQKFISWVNIAGFIFLIGLMIVITISDIFKLV